MSDNIEKMGNLNITLKYDDIIDEYSKKCCSLVRNRSPKATGYYKDGWTTEVEKTRSGSYGVVVWNQKDWQLTHLLENGHIIANKRDGTGWSPAIPHIAPAFKSVRGKFIKAMENVNVDFKSKKG